MSFLLLKSLFSNNFCADSELFVDFGKQKHLKQCSGSSSQPHDVYVFHLSVHLNRNIIEDCDDFHI